MQTIKILEAFPYLRVRNANAAIEYYKSVFGAVETLRLVEPSGRIGHAELKFGSYTVMISDEYPEYGIYGPQSHGVSSTHVGTGASVHLHVEDVDELTRRAVAAGAKVLMEPTDQFYGERSSKVLDPFGHEWMIGSQIEEISSAEMQRRFTAMFEAPNP